MWVAFDAVAYLFVADILCPDSCVGEEEALETCKTVLDVEIDGIGGLLGILVFEGLERDDETSVVCDVLTEGKRAVGIEAWEYLD